MLWATVLLWCCCLRKRRQPTTDLADKKPQGTITCPGGCFTAGQSHAAAPEASQRSRTAWLARLRWGRSGGQAWPRFGRRPRGAESVSTNPPELVSGDSNPSLQEGLQQQLVSDDLGPKDRSGNGGEGEAVPQRRAPPKAWWEEGVEPDVPVVTPVSAVPPGVIEMHVLSFCTCCLCTQEQIACVVVDLSGKHVLGVHAPR